MIKTDFTPYSPQMDYTATVEITGNKEELSALYGLLQQIEPCSDYERRMKSNVLSELRAAHDWITDMEDIDRRKT